MDKLSDKSGQVIDLDNLSGQVTEVDNLSEQVICIIRKHNGNDSFHHFPLRPLVKVTTLQPCGRVSVADKPFTILKISITSALLSFSQGHNPN